MCNPMLVAVGFSALSTGASYMSQKSAAEDQAKYNQKVVNANAKNANEAYVFNTQQEQTRVIQEEASIKNDIQQVDLERRRASGEAVASSNGAAMNLEYLLGDYMRQQGGNTYALNNALDQTLRQSQNNLKGYEAQAKDRIASVNPAPVSSPSLVGALAGFGASAAGTYGDYRNSKGKSK